MAATRRVGTRARPARPSPWVLLGLGAAFLGINHLAVVSGNGLHAEAMVVGCWLVLMGGWVLIAGRTFDDIWAWVDPSGWRVMGFIVFMLVVSGVVAEVVARFGYGQQLLG